ncbi:MAG TPA: tetratricopeptide repeat protein [Mariniflexile sp.]
MPPNTTRYIDYVNEIGYSYWIVDSKESITYGKEALELSDSLNYVVGKAKANRVLGVAYWAQGNHVNATKHLNEALHLNKDLGNEEDMANTTLNLAMVYAALKNNDKALQLYEDAIDQFTVQNLKSRIATTYTKIASIYLDEDNFTDAKTYLDNALIMHTEENFTYGMAEVHNRLGILYLKQQEKEQAFYHIRKSIMLGHKVNDVDGMTSNLIQYGKLLILDKDFVNAENHLKLALRRAQQNKLKRYELEAYHELKELKQIEGKPDEALVYYDSYITLKDSIYNSEKAIHIASLEFKYDMSVKQKQLELLTEKQRANDIVKWSLIIGLIGLILFVILWLLNYKKQNSQKAELEKAKEEFNRAELENSKLKQKELQQQLDYRNKELTSYTLNFVQKSGLFQQLKDGMNDLKMASPKQQDQIVANLNRILKQSINIDKEWEDFKRFFEDVHTGFIENLKEKHADLSGNDLKICALTRLNLNIKETATILGITPESVKTARYRLRKKLDLDQNDDLLTYFLSLETE